MSILDLHEQTFSDDWMISGQVNKNLIEIKVSWKWYDIQHRVSSIYRPVCLHLLDIFK